MISEKQIHYKLWELYPYMVVVTNVALTDYPFNARYTVDNAGNAHIFDLVTDEEIILGDYKKGENDLVNGKIPYICIEYDGLDCLKYINNRDLGVVFFIDELHLELNSLESKNIDIDVMVEISQQRKQRKKNKLSSIMFMS